MASSHPDAATTISACLEADHRRLDALLREVARGVGEAAFDQAQSGYAAFRTGLDLHIQVEEEVLFPAFERESGMTGGPTQVMRIEHVQIREAMEEADRALHAGDAAAFERVRAGLEDVLSDHNMKEEHVLYPMCDRALSSDDVRQVVDRLHAGR